jgi:hypothetical protein
MVIECDRHLPASSHQPIALPPTAQASADPCYHTLGTASGGQSVKLDRCTLERQRDRRVNFTIDRSYDTGVDRDRISRRCQ